MKKRKISRFLSFLGKKYTPLTILIRKNKLLCFILFIAYFVRILGLIPNEYHEDEPWIEKYSAQIFYNVVTKGDFNPLDYKYGSFTFYLDALPHIPVSLINYSKDIVQEILFPTNPSHRIIPSYQQYIKNLGPPLERNIIIFWMQRAMAALLGGTTVFVVYQIAKKLFNHHIALLSSFALAILPLHVRESHYFVPDIPMTFFVLLATLAMVNLFQSNKLKWYVISGVLIGFSSTFKYFPLAFLAYPFAVLLAKQKNGSWILKILTGILGMIVGAFVGAPYLFFDSHARLFFHNEMTNYVLLWYATPFTRYAQAMGDFISSHGHAVLPSFATFIPTSFRPFYASLLFFRGLGQIPSIVSILGMFVLLFSYPKRFLFLTIIPLFVFVYNSAYVPATYERQADPMLPFLALFIGIFLYFLWELLKKSHIEHKKILYGLLLTLTFFYPLTQSFSSSWACGEKSVFDQSTEWIDNNIPENETVAFKTHLPFPSKPLTLIPMTVADNFSLEEVKQQKANYAFINYSTVITTSMNEFTSDFFIPPPDVYQNNFVSLSLSEYQKRARLLHTISKPTMCNQPTLIYYKLPSELKPAAQSIKKISFDSPDTLGELHLQKLSIGSDVTTLTYVKTDGHDKQGSIKYAWNKNTYTLPPLRSSKIEVEPGETYTFSAWVKASQQLKQIERDGFLRIDFYKDANDQTSLPGEILALSPRTFGDTEWKELSITARAPEETKIMIVSFQAIGTKPEGSFLLDDIQIRGPKTGR